MLGAVLFAPRVAMATTTDATQVELRYVVDKSIPDCLSEERFQDAVRRRLEHDALAPGAPLVVTTRLERIESERLRATMTVEGQNAPSASQEVFASLGECATLSATAALVVSLTIERMRGLVPPPPPEVPVEVPPPAPAESPAAKPARPPERQPVKPPPTPRRAARELRTHALATLGYGILPDTALGASVGASMRFGRASAGLDAGTWLPNATYLESTRAGARAWLVFLSGSACLAGRGLFVCGVGTFGDFRASGTGRLLSQSSGSTYAALGGRVGAEIPLAFPFSLVIHGAALAPLVRPSLRVGDWLLWRAPWIGGELGIGIRMSIL
jgi:hypothetical protein